MGNPVTWTSPSAPGSYTVTVTVADGKGGVVTRTCVVVVSSANQPPVITSVTANPSAVGLLGSSTITCDARDPDGDSLSYSWTATGGSVPSSGNPVTWTPPSTAGSYTITVTVRDGRGGETRGECVVGVIFLRINRLPVITSVTANPSTVGSGGRSTITCVASDPDGDSLSYTWSAMGSSVPGLGNQVTWTAPSAPGSYTITLTVADGKGGVVTRTCVVVVSSANQPPVITSVTANPSAVGLLGSSTITCDARDPDGDSLSYSWTATGGSVPSSGNPVTWTPPSTAGSYTITVTVRDGRGGETRGECVVGVIFLRINRLPVITSVTANPSTVGSGGRSTITCVASDPDGDSLSYTWEATGGSVPSSGNPVIWTAPSAPGSYTIKVTVADGRGGTARGSCVVNVLFIIMNRLPVIYSLTANPSTVSPLGSSTITCDARDPDGDRLSYTWSATGGYIPPSGNPVTWKAPKVFPFPGQTLKYTITVTVSDGRGGTTTGKCVVGVR